MDNLENDPRQASDTLFDRALKQPWPAMEAAIVARMVRPLREQDVDGPPFRRELVAATKYLLEADQLILEQDVPGNPHRGTAPRTALPELLQYPDYLDFLRVRACAEDSRTRPDLPEQRPMMSQTSRGSPSKEPR
jgi:hypothetical protein